MSPIARTSSERIAVLGELLREISHAQSPSEITRSFVTGYRRIRQVDMHMAVSVRGLAPGQYKITRMISPEQTRAGDVEDYAAADPWRDWEQIPAHESGLIAELISTPEPKLRTHLRVDKDPVLGDAASGLGSCLAIPLYDAGEAQNWTVTFRRDPEGFTHADLEQGYLVANLVGTATRNLLALQQNRELTRQLERQFEEVARVQQTLLPRKTPDIPGLSIATSYLTSQQAGGDYYDFFRLPDGEWGILIADVSGHGAAAATVMAMLHAILHGYAGPDFQPHAIMSYVNRRLVEAELEGMFVTAFLAVYDPEDGTLRYARSGHNPPLLKKTGSAEVHAIDGQAVPPLGIFADGYEPVSNELALDSGDTLVLYTDGITEEFGPDREMFGVERLNNALRSCSGEPECVIDSVHAALFQHTGKRDRGDDQTLVVIRYLGKLGADA